MTALTAAPKRPRAAVPGDGETCQSDSGYRASVGGWWITSSRSTRMAGFRGTRREVRRFMQIRSRPSRNSSTAEHPSPRPQDTSGQAGQPHTE